MSSTMPSLMAWHAASFKPSSESSIILGIMIPGVSTKYMGGSETILNPEILLVTQGYAPDLAPDLLFEFFDIVGSFALSEFIMVDFPIFGIPPIITQAPTVLNLDGHSSISVFNNFYIFVPAFVLVCMYSKFESLCYCFMRSIDSF